MLNFKRFSGIDNVGNAERLAFDKRNERTALAEAMNVDIGLDEELLRRQGFTEASAVCHKNVWQGSGFMLATVDGGDLVSIDPDGDETVLYASLGSARVWYSNLPDGRTTFSNGLINGVASLAAATKWGVPVAGTLGAASEVAGDLFAGSYRYALTYKRTSDGLEGGPIYSTPITLGADSGLALTGLPTLAGHSINVYLTQHNGMRFYYAGNTTNALFQFASENRYLTLPLLTDQVQPAPVGTISATWRGRALVAVGPQLYASKHGQPEHFILSDAFKTFGADITLVQPVEGGIFVGTDAELVFLAGTEWAALSPRQLVEGAVVLGSGVTVPGKYLKRGDGTAGERDCMVCIADQVITAGYPDGSIAALTEGRYEIDSLEVAAAFRVREGRIPQYVAIPQ